MTTVTVSEDIIALTEEVVETITVIVAEQGPPGVDADHSGLLNLDADTHLQYHTDARGDARYSPLAHDHSGVYEPADADLQSHLISTSNPHSVTAAQVGADATGTAAGLIASHESALDPHPGYLTPTEGDVAYAAIGHAHTGVYEAAGAASSAVSSHEGDADPHPGYALESSLGGAALLSVGTTTGTVAAGDDARFATGTTGDAFASSHPGGNQHIDWTADQGATNVHAANIPDLSVTYAPTSHDHALVYAPIAQGVTNGDSHDHSGSDGAQISYSTLSNLPTLGTAAATASTDYATASHNHTGTYLAAGADAADLTSGAATDGQVLTADGVGGSAWINTPYGASTDEYLSGDVTLRRIAYDTISGSGLLKDTLMDSGDVWKVTGEGYATATINPAGYVESALNAYCYIEVSTPIYRSRQLYSGPHAVTAIAAADTGFSSMWHVEFTPSVATGFFWGYLSETVGFVIESMPNIDNGIAHELIVDVFDGFVAAYCDGRLKSIAYCKYAIGFVGLATYWQLTGETNGRIYGCSVYSINAETNARLKPCVETPNAINTRLLHSSQIAIGDKSHAKYNPRSGSYFFTTGFLEKHVFESTATTILEISTNVENYSATLSLDTYYDGFGAEITATAGGILQIRNNGETRLSMPAFVSRVDFPSMRILADGLPTSTSGLTTGELWVDTSILGGMVKRVSTDSPSASIHTIKTTEQLRLGYDATKYVSHTVDSSGNCLIDAVGTVKIGDSTNYAQFATDGTLTLAGTATAWDDLSIPGFAVRTGASAPDFEANFIGDATLWAFNFNGASTLEEVHFSVQMPHAWKEGSTIYPHVHFSPTSTNGADAVSRTVKFVLEYTWANVNATYGATATLAMTNDFVPNTSQWAHLIASNATGIDGTGKTLSSILMCRLYRDPADAADTYPQDVAFLSFDVHYERDALGSSAEYTK